MKKASTLWTWFRNLLKEQSKPTHVHGQRHASWPTREEIEQLPWFNGLDLKDIVVLMSDAGARHAYEELSKEMVVGFDTESKPTFKKGEVSTGPHVAQFATPKRAYVFTLHHRENRRVVADLMKLSTLTKVGFGLGDDLKRIRTKFGVESHAVIDLETLFTANGHGRGVGAKVAIALLFKRRFRKSRRASTSNWMNHRLTDQQVLYAANDAYAAISAYHALQRKRP